MASFKWLCENHVRAFDGCVASHVYRQHPQALATPDTIRRPDGNEVIKRILEKTRQGQLTRQKPDGTFEFEVSGFLVYLSLKRPCRQTHVSSSLACVRVALQ